MYLDYLYVRFRSTTVIMKLKSLHRTSCAMDLGRSVDHASIQTKNTSCKRLGQADIGASDLLMANLEEIKRKLRVHAVENSNFFNCFELENY